MKEFQVGVIGAGSPCIATSRHLPCLDALDGFKLCVLADVNRGVQDYAEKYGCDWTLDPYELIGRDDIDVVVVCAPDQLHYGFVKAALEKKKQVICEKPLALTRKECRELYKLALENRLLLSIVSNTRSTLFWREFHEKLCGVKILKYSITSSIFPYPEGSFYRTKEGGGQFLHNGYHLVDLMSYLADSAPESTVGITAHGGPDADRYDFDTYTVAQIKMENGVLAVIEQNLTRASDFVREERLSARCFDSSISYDSSTDSISPEKFDYDSAFRRYYGDIYALLTGDRQAAISHMRMQEKIMNSVLETIGRRAMMHENNTCATMLALEAKADKMKSAVLNSCSECISRNTTYYFSADGNDSADGLSEATAKCTLCELERLTLSEGDTVLFRRGDRFRGQVLTRTANVTYSAYGEGAKPTITASRRNYADRALWCKTAHDNVWMLAEKLHNVGIILLDHSGEIGIYDAHVAAQKIRGVDGFVQPADLCENAQFYSDLADDSLYFYESRGNPGEVYTSIEIGDGRSIFCGIGDGITVDNLHITVTGCHGVGYGNCTNLTVQNCIFDYIGGSVLFDTTRYGNAVQIWSRCNGFYVRDNWIYQIYDTGITHQYMDENDHSEIVMQNIDVTSNLIEYCYWGIEYWNVVSSELTPRKTRNVAYRGNFIRNTGYGFGTLAHPGHKIHHTQSLQLGSIPHLTENFTVSDNIFDRSAGVLICVTTDVYKFSRNTYIQPRGALYAQLLGKQYFFSEDMDKIHASCLDETDATFVIID